MAPARLSVTAPRLRLRGVFRGWALLYKAVSPPAAFGAFPMHPNRFHGRPKALLTWLLLGLALPALAARGPEVPDYPADLLAPGLYVIHGPVAYPTPENQGSDRRRDRG